MVVKVKQAGGGEGLQRMNKYKGRSWEAQRSPVINRFLRAKVVMVVKVKQAGGGEGWAFYNTK
jgi:hypothetical protein